MQQDPKHSDYGSDDPSPFADPAMREKMLASKGIFAAVIAIAMLAICILVFF